MTTRLLKAGLMIYLVLMTLSVLFAISNFDFHEHLLGVVGLLSVLTHPSRVMTATAPALQIEVLFDGYIQE